MKTKYEIILEYLEETNKYKGLGCNEYTPLIQMINKDMDLFGRDLEVSELSYLTTTLRILMDEYPNYSVMFLIRKILKGFEQTISDNLKLTQFIEYIEKELNKQI